MNPRKNSNRPVADQYFVWLCDQVSDQRQQKKISEFLKTLHELEFYWTIPNDDNRGEDGKKLREEFCYQYRFSCAGLILGKCTILEMLVALAKRIEYQMSDPNDPNDANRYFWMMLDNLGLELFVNTDPNFKEKAIRNDIKLRKFLSRQYDKYGKGGLFPLVSYAGDQRKVEIWYQMSAYLEENFEK
jgi:hypothetical protein